MFEYYIHRAQKSRYMCLFWNLAIGHLFALSSNLLLLLLFLLYDAATCELMTCAATI